MRGGVLVGKVQKRSMFHLNDHFLITKNLTKKSEILSLKDIYFFFFIRWTEIIILFHLSFYLTWLLFAVIYYAICYFHGDLEPENLPPMQV
jgi:potassium inwardly-rectifying channel subfamily J